MEKRSLFQIVPVLLHISVRIETLSDSFPGGLMFVIVCPLHPPNCINKIKSGADPRF